MAQWEYRHERMERPLGSGGRDVTPETLRELNRLGAEGWEVCGVCADQQAWLVLLKREMPVLGLGGSGAPGGSGGAA